MPVYCYSCKDCDHSFEIRHSMNFEDQTCLKCDSERVFRVPSLQNKIKKTSNTSHRVGKVVDDFIKDTKKELSTERKNLQKEIY